MTAPPETMGTRKTAAMRRVGPWRRLPSPIDGSVTSLRLAGQGLPSAPRCRRHGGPGSGSRHGVGYAKSKIRLTDPQVAAGLGVVSTQGRRHGVLVVLPSRAAMRLRGQDVAFSLGFVCARFILDRLVYKVCGLVGVVPVKPAAWYGDEEEEEARDLFGSNNKEYVKTRVATT
ncbi:hypothetical protein VPH35_027511 [Triticum aestivum]